MVGTLLQLAAVASCGLVAAMEVQKNDGGQKNLLKRGRGGGGTGQTQAQHITSDGPDQEGLVDDDHTVFEHATASALDDPPLDDEGPALNTTTAATYGFLQKREETPLSTLAQSGKKMGPSRSQKLGPRSRKMGPEKQGVGYGNWCSCNRWLCWDCSRAAAAAEAASSCASSGSRSCGRRAGRHAGWCYSGSCLRGRALDEAPARREPRELAHDHGRRAPGSARSCRARRAPGSRRRARKAVAKCTGSGIA